MNLNAQQKVVGIAFLVMAALSSQLSCSPNVPPQERFVEKPIYSPTSDLRVFVPATGTADLSPFESLMIDVRNNGTEPVVLVASAENAVVLNGRGICSRSTFVAAKADATVTLRLVPPPRDPGYDLFVPWFRYTDSVDVNSGTIDPSAVARVTLRLKPAGDMSSISVAGIRTAGGRANVGQPFFPFVDRYGQYIHAEWAGKVHADLDLLKAVESEQRALQVSGAPPHRNAYGGWLARAAFQPTGFFRVEKVDGQWWLIDPSGRLFWSYGITCVNFAQADPSPLDERRHWFEDLPEEKPPWAQFYVRDTGATYLHYRDRSWTAFDFARANLFRKFGKSFEQASAESAQDRLHAWGFNTLGNWPDRRTALLRRTPYTVAVHYQSPMLHFSTPDVFDPRWEPAVRAAMDQERNSTANDPWNIGYFVDNERWWGAAPRAGELGQIALAQPAASAAKQRFIDLMRERYKSIRSLNAAWLTQYPSWDAMRQVRVTVDLGRPAIAQDCGDFGMLFADRYFSVVREVVKAVAPNQLYLGVRFNGNTDRALIELASKYCDVISYNIYERLPTHRMSLYAGIDRPFLCSEWGIGSDPQQTPFRESSQSPDPAARVKDMTAFLEAALSHPNLVGAHFFQYRDQPISGRPDGEAMPRGFVSITDMPHDDLVAASRAFSWDLYQRRWARSGSDQKR